MAGRNKASLTEDEGHPGMENNSLGGGMFSAGKAERDALSELRILK